MDLRTVWDFSDPAGSEVRFRSLLSSVDDVSLRFEIECQIARTYSLRKMCEESHAVLDAVVPLLESVSPRAVASYELERGRAFNTAGKVEEARALFEVTAKSPVDDLRIDAIHMLAYIENDPAEAERLNRVGLEQAEASPGPMARRWKGTLYNNLGWALHDAGRFDEALDSFGSALECRISQGDQKTTNVAKWCFARCLRSLGRFEEALAIQEELLAAGDPQGFAAAEIAELKMAMG